MSHLVHCYCYSTPEGFDDIALVSCGDRLTYLGFVTSALSFQDSNEGECSEVLRDTVAWLDAYFAGIVTATLPLLSWQDVSPFTQEVLRVVQRVGWGDRCTYGELARLVAAERGVARMSAQAVGHALHQNPFCIIIPCHRVVGSNGALVGYRYGLANKERLLQWEQSIKKA